MINHCYNNVPFYKKLFDEIKLKPSEINALEDLHRIPLLTRDQVKNNLSSLIARNIPKNQRLIRNTSGTTGSPMFFFVDKKSYSINSAYTRRYWNWTGFDYGDKRLTLQGRRIVHHNRIKPPFWMYNKWDKQLFFSTYHLSEEFIPFFVDKLIEFNPQAIDAYPSAIYVLAKYMDENNVKHNMKAVFTSSETLYPIQREVIERVFQCKIFDKYGLSEMFFVGTECEQHNGLHLNMEYAITEVVDKNDEPVPLGKKGRVICTCLENLSMPLIRYDTGDIGRILPDKCSCGRNLSLMAPVTTKAEDQVLTPDGRYISGSLLTFPFKPMKNIIRSQIVQDDIYHIKIKIVKNNSYSNEDSKILLEGLSKCLGRTMKVTLEFVDDIERTKNGKYRWVVSNVHKKMDFRKDNI
ncbi:MAG: phenylacetate--CoA ligase family protein [Candidatus Scalindua sp.]